MKEPEMKRIASLIDRVLKAPEDESNLRAVHDDVKELALAYPLYPSPVGVEV
jgi:glycine/serine hydroxymethyltransferase